MSAALHSPSPRELEEGYKAFQANERRDAMYVTASFLVDHDWDRPPQLANGLGVLLLTWNQAFYRYGIFDFDRLEACIRRNAKALSHYRARHILDAQESDGQPIEHHFLQFLDALAIAVGSKKDTRSPVAAAKALHLLAPGFFPLWDKKIADTYACRYAIHPERAYLKFFWMTHAIAQAMPTHLRDGTRGKTLLKLIDEYNYAKYTKGWV